MKISIDPVISSRIKRAWNALPKDQQNRIAPMLAKANLQAVTVSQTGKAPLAYSAIKDDQDGVVSNLEAGVVIDVDADGQIWGTGKYKQLDPGWVEAIAVWLEHLILGKHAFNPVPPTISIPDDVQIAIAGDWGTGDWRPTTANPAPSTDVRTHMAFLQPHLTIHLGDVYYAGTDDEEDHLLVSLWPAGSIGALAGC